MSNNFETITYQREGSVARIYLNRPELHNAFNDIMIAELTPLLEGVAADRSLRVVVLGANGRSFCAGADLNWMKRQKDYSFEQNKEDASALADLMYRLFTMPQPVIGRVQGATIGGGTGLASACDIVIASTRARFSLSEVKIGLVPACISPYVIRRLGPGLAGEYFLTGERLTASKALAAGLINEVVEETELDASVERRIEQLITSGPEALNVSKELVRNVPGMSFDAVKDYTAEVIARLRISDEGQEGMNAFFEKRKPGWCSKTAEGDQ
ncbi:MAG: enoyl-CoA hydratase/isomerase family protein [Candidatus Delongbacteria bacterium]|nr:enoyl-CoA hydratase/isomerase family protein [Candidatus Delongbacteria bacterium]